MTMTTSKQSADPDTEVRTAVPPKPVWVERSTTPCRYCSPDDSDEDDGDDGFWYDTKEDFRNGLSYLGHPDSMLSPDFQNKTYSLPPYGEMHTTVIDGQAWCSLDDVGRFAGIQTCKSITGCAPNSSVRGYPGYLIPDGIRHLSPQNILGEGVRLEAIISHLMKARDGKRFTEWLVKTVIPDVYVDDPAMADAAREIVAATAATASDRLDSPARSTRVDEVHLYDDCYGEFRTVIIGTRRWFRLDDIAAYLSVPLETICLLLGSDRVIDVGKMGDHDSSHVVGLHSQYVEYATFRKLLKLSHSGTSHIDSLAPWAFWHLNKVIASYGVTAGTLHQMLGRQQTFEAWYWETNRNYGHALSRLEDHPRSNKLQDLRVPLKLALKIALKEQRFAGAITYCLLADGGYLHGGTWNESAENCLKRFRKLIPDRQGRVDRRKMKEFLEPRGSTNNQYDIDEASETEFMTSEEAWELFRESFGMTTNSLRKFGLKRITEDFCPVPPPLPDTSEGSIQI